MTVFWTFYGNIKNLRIHKNTRGSFMLCSMTGYGSGEAALGDRRLAVEIRAVNHRFLDVSIKMPRSFLPLETEMKKLVAGHISRGKVEVSIQYAGAKNGAAPLVLDRDRARHICELVRALKETVPLPGDFDFPGLLLFKDLFIAEGDETVEPALLRQTLLPCLEWVLAEMQDMQRIEGAAIADDIRQRVEGIAQDLAAIERRAPAARDERVRMLRERVAALCNGVAVDEQRMVQEIALLADRSDITEELVRAQSHLRQFQCWLNGSEPAGKKLDFLLQELHREVNTIGSKAADADISLHVVGIKNELEKIREQLQNAM